jgi:hypothetical protein
MDIMNKPVIFFSHSSRDAAMLGKLKDLFVSKTGGTIDVFVSSDGQSIPLGRNWVHRIEEALQQAKIMFVFITPNALKKSNWLFFESGFAYSKDIRVIPVTYGIDFDHLPAPLNLLQGFNLTSEDSLDNFIAIVNEAFGYKHSACFTKEEFNEIVSLGNTLSLGKLGNYSSFIDGIIIETSLKSRENPTIFDNISSLLTERKVDFRAISDGSYTSEIVIPGISINDDHRTNFRLEVDPPYFARNIELIESVLQALKGEKDSTIWLKVFFVDEVRSDMTLRKLLGHLYSFGAQMGQSHDWFHYEGLDFKVEWRDIIVDIRNNSIPLSSIIGLIDALFESSVYEHNLQR